MKDCFLMEKFVKTSIIFNCTNAGYLLKRVDLQEILENEYAQYTFCLIRRNLR